jgi:hypothetical protein
VAVDLVGALRADAVQEEEHAVPRDRVLRVRDDPEMASTSFTCAVSMNLKPPRFTNGTSARCSSSSRSKEWKLERKRTGHLVERTRPSSRSSRMRWVTKRDCACSSPHWRRSGAAAVRLSRTARRTFVCFSAARSMIAFASSRIGCGRAVVLLELHDPRAREQLREVHDVPERRAPERVDALAVVPDRHHVVVRARQAADDLRLQRVRVLVLVDHHVAVGARELLRDVGMVAQEVAEEHEEIVVIDEVLLALVAGVLLADPDEVVEVVVQLRVAVLHHLGDRLRPVHRHAQDLDDRALPRESAVLLVEARPRAEEVHDVLRVAAVEDREVRLQAEPPRRPAEDDVRERVERASRNLLAARPDEPRRRRSISSAAFRVNVRRRIWPGFTPDSTRRATR